MANLRKWSTSASGNATVAGGANTISFAEGQSPGSVNNSAREMMAQVRSIYTPGEWGWVEHSATVSVASQTVIKLAGNQTTNFSAARRVRLKSGSSTRYASVVSASFTTETTITLTVDSGSLSASHSIVALSMYDGNNLPNFVTSNSASVMIVAAVPAAATTTQAQAGTNTSRFVTPDAMAALWEAGTDITDGATITIGEGGYFNLITSTTSITAFTVTTDKAGRTFRVRFDTARTLTHNATSLILPTSANITTAQGDIAQFRSLGSGNVVCEWYTRATGFSLRPPITSLGSINTSSGASASLGSLTLTGYKFLKLVVIGISSSSATNFLIGTSTSDDVRFTADMDAAGSLLSGLIEIDLVTGIGTAVLTDSNNSQSAARAFDSTITTAATTISIAPASGSLDAGSITVYGVA